MKAVNISNIYVNGTGSSNNYFNIKNIQLGYAGYMEINGTTV